MSSQSEALEFIKWPPRFDRARDLIGVPYRRGGVTPAEGFDCFTLLAYVRWHFFARETPLSSLPKRHLSTGALCAIMIRRALGDHDQLASPWARIIPQEGCAVALGRSKFGRLHHCGVWCDAGVLHALDSVGVCFTPASRLSDLYGRVECYELCPRA